MKTKRKVGKSLNVRKLVKHVKEWRLDTENMNKVIKKYPEKFKPEAKKSCATCFYQGADGHKTDTRLPCLDCCLADDHNKHLEWKPKQEEKIVYYCPVDSAYRDFVCGDKEGIAKCTAKKYIIFKECNQPFKLIKVEAQ
jgi:hypothetical protein